MQAAPPSIDSAPAVDQPCIVHSRHDPTPLLTQAHHVFPVELQKVVWTGISRDDPHSIKAKHTIPVCGTGHDTIHVILRQLIESGGTAKPSSSAHAHEWTVAIAGFVQFQQAQKDPGNWTPPQ